MADGVSPEVLHALGQLLGEKPVFMGRTDRGESASTYVLSSQDGELVLKLVQDDAGSLPNLQRLVRLVEGLRTRGYPAPEYLGVGRAGGVAFSVQRKLEGETLDHPGLGQRPDPDLFAGLLPDLLAAVALQADSGDLDRPPWPHWLIATITEGGQGYCLHETMRRRTDTRDLLARLQAVASRNWEAPVRAADVVHFDLNPTNILQRGGRLAGLVDWNIPFAGAGQGDRGFDLATLLFYTYDIPATRQPLWDALIEVSGLSWSAVYLAHLCLRQVEWSVRNRPSTHEEARFLAIAGAVLDLCVAAGA